MTDKKSIKIAVLGAGGRMGRNILAALQANPQCEIVAAVDRAESPDIGRDVGALIGGDALGVVLTSDVRAAAQQADALIDFSSPAALADALAASRAGDCAYVCGTTGLEQAHYDALAEAANDIAVLYASNMTFGMAVLNRLSAQATKMLGDDFDVEIVEMHHRHKKDAPSGSALTLGETIADARGTTLEKAGAFGRHGHAPRQAGDIGFAALRGGDVAGDHTVIFAGAGERLELTFRASDRSIFAKGAVRAAVWLAAQTKGYYGINDMLDALTQ